MAIDYLREQLKLPICPRCGETKGVTNDVHQATKITMDIGTYFHCPRCKIDWNYNFGIKERGDI